MRAIIFILVSLLLTAYTNAQSTKLIAVAKAFKKGSGDCWYMSECVGYRYIISTDPNVKSSELRIKVREDATQFYGTDNVMEYTNGFKKEPVLCVLAYVKDKGKPCEARQIALGFGTDKANAYDNAVKEMRLYYKGPDFSVEKYIE